MTGGGGRRAGELRLSRRHFISGSTALSASAALSAVGRAGTFGDIVDLRPSQPPLQAPSPHYTAPRPMTVRALQAPDFSLLHPETPFLAGVRPYREGGMRLELRPPVEVGNARKIVIHNYGHGGAGMSLAFGVAERVRDLVVRASTQHLDGEPPPAIAVLGAGVMGLTTTLALRSRFPEAKLTIYALECDGRRTTSYLAGGKFAHIGEIVDPESTALRSEVQGHLDRAETRLGELQRNGGGVRYGIATRPSYSLAGGGSVRVRIGQATLTANQYSTWLIDPTRLLPVLRRELESKSVHFVARTFDSERDVYALDEPVIVNCTGMGAREVFGDQQLVGRRGHLVRLQNPGKLDYMLNSWCGDAPIRYLFARHDDIVIGGSLQNPNGRDGFDAADSGDTAICERLLRNARALTEIGGTRCS